MFQDVFYKF